VITLRALGAAAIDKLLFNYPSNSILGRHKISRNLTVDTIKVKTREGTAFATVWIMSTPIRAKGHKAPKSAARS